jgi:type II secretory ATPase GspE/PulE/Tfp pilus assembly ATPase PilB-like protein
VYDACGAAVTDDPVGCDNCRGMGYRGRIGVFEIWRLDEADYDHILTGWDERSLIVDGLIKAATGVTFVGELQAMGEVVPPQPEVRETLAGQIEAALKGDA